MKENKTIEHQCHSVKKLTLTFMNKKTKSLEKKQKTRIQPIEQKRPVRNLLWQQIVRWKAQNNNNNSC